MKRLIAGFASSVLAAGMLLALAPPASAQYYDTDDSGRDNLYLAVWDTVHISPDGSSASWDIIVSCVGDATYFTINSASVEERNPPEIPQLAGEDNGIPARAGQSSHNCDDARVTVRLATQNTHWQDCVRDENGGIIECYQREGYFPLHAARADDFDTGVSIGVTSYNDSQERVGSAIYCAHPACAGTTGPYVNYDGGPSRAPAPPTASFGAILSNSILVRWNAPASGARPTSYLWGWTGSDGSSWSKEYPAGDPRIASPFRLTNLKPNTSYTISIQSKNASGTSSQLLMTATTARASGGGTTPPPPPPPPPPPGGGGTNPPPPHHSTAKKPGKPVGVKGRAGLKSATISWRSAAAHGARINSYQVHRFNGGNKTVKASARSVAFKGLKPSKTYRFYVRAHNSKGWGPWSKIVQVKPKAPKPKAKPHPQPSQPRCHPDYSGCLPIVGDLDCSQIGHPVRILHGRDPYGLDSDGDGMGCESS